MSWFFKKFTKCGSGSSKKLLGMGLCRSGNTKFGRVGLRNSILFLFSSRVRKVLALIFNFPQNRLPICFFIPCSSPNVDFFFHFKFLIFNFFPKMMPYVHILLSNLKTWFFCYTTKKVHFFFVVFKKSMAGIIDIIFRKM